MESGTIFSYKRRGGGAMQQEALNLVEFQRKFAIEEACMEHLFTL